MVLLNQKRKGEKMKKRKYVIRDTEAEGEPIIKEGESDFYADDIALCPKGFGVVYVNNRPDLKTIFVVGDDDA